MSVGALLVGLGDIPELPGASCREHVALFDRATGEGTGPSLSVRRARDQAREVCESCPVLDNCRAWLEATTPSRRPCGVVAGVYIDASGRFPADRERKRLRLAGASRK